jgi:hypothetical protein
MAKKGQSTPTPAAPPSGGTLTNPGISKVQTSPSETESKKAAKTPQVPQATVKQAAGAAKIPAFTSNAAGASVSAQAPKSPTTSKKKKKKKKNETPRQPAQVPKQSSALNPASYSAGRSDPQVVYPSESSIKKPMSTALFSAVDGPSTAMKAKDPGPGCQSLKSHGSASAIESSSNIVDQEVFRLAAATPVPISPTVERQFYESQLLLYVLERVRGDHSKRQNYHGELDQDSTELRRSFVDKLAYICDFKKGGSTVTALALQKTYQGVTFWLAANETVKPKVIDFLRQIFKILKQAEDGVTKEDLERQLIARIVPFNEERLDYYWSALDKDLDLCVERLKLLQGTTSKLSSVILLLPIQSRSSIDPIRYSSRSQYRICHRLTDDCRW